MQFLVWYAIMNTVSNPLKLSFIVDDCIKKRGRDIMNVIDKITEKQKNPNVVEFRVGDTVRVDVKIVEGNKERIQAYEGIVIARRGSGISETFTVRKVSYGVGVERTFPVHSPRIANMTVVKKGKVRRAKLNFLRSYKGQYRIKERANKEAA